MVGQRKRYRERSFPVRHGYNVADESVAVGQGRIRELRPVDETVPVGRIRGQRRVQRLQPRRHQRTFGDGNRRQRARRRDQPDGGLRLRARQAVHGRGGLRRQRRRRHQQPVPGGVEPGQQRADHRVPTGLRGQHPRRRSRRLLRQRQAAAVDHDQRRHERPAGRELRPAAHLPQRAGR